MPKVALVTGASSGIGLALTKHLLTKAWNVVLADVVPPKQEADLPAERTLYIRTDVSNFDEQAELFSQGFKWHGRLDFAALNAGIEDRDDIFATIDPSAPPTKPDMSALDVDLTAVYYGIKLFAHYAARNPIPGGKIVATSSVAGLYPSPGLPQYTAAKHGVVGLVRSLAPVAAPHNITINAVCPALVVTNLDPSLSRRFPEKLLTDMSIMMQAFDELTDETLGYTGRVVEACAEGLYYKKIDESEAPSMKELLLSPSLKEWMESLVEKNVQRALEIQRSNSQPALPK
jgi:15-hydroxyprostaglandin dehydrogenase (NAD)